ncbi:HAD-IIIA family hydrolase [Anabaena minutissima FACHB-250]|nr:HAD-IIIA family hydrolase [Anabaena minutissima FACHB-250]
MAKLLFVDVDGTLTETISGETFKQHPKDIKIIEGADKAIAYFADKEYTILGVSNQGGVASNFKTIAATIEEMQFTLHLLPELQLIYFCPDFEGKVLWSVSRSGAAEVDTFGLSSCRKPNPGMIEYVAKNYAEVDLKLSWLIGDRPEDEQAAANAGINFCPADMWRDRFRKGTFAHAATPEQIKFLEGIGTTAVG